MTQRSNEAALDSWEELARKLEGQLRVGLGDKFETWTRRMNANVVAYAPDIDESEAATVLEAMNKPWAATPRAATR